MFINVLDYILWLYYFNPGRDAKLQSPCQSICSLSQSSKVHGIFCTLPAQCSSDVWGQCNMLWTSFLRMTLCFHTIWRISCTASLTDDRCQLAGRNASRLELQCFSCAPLQIASHWLTSLTVCLAVHNRVWLWRHTMHCTKGAKSAIPNCLVMATLHSRWGHYIFILWFLLLSFFFFLT